MSMKSVATGFAAGALNMAKNGKSGLDRAINEDRIRIAVTGLSLAGKTVFITSLIHNLLALGRGADTLPILTKRLSHNGVSRLRSVEVLPAGAGLLPCFDYASKLSELSAENPSWPPRTEDLAEISLSLEIERPSPAGRRLGSRRIRLDILDYPGEWLLDLPLLNQTYAAWSAQTLALLRTSPRHECSGAFLAYIEDLRPEDRAEESLLSRGHKLYREAILTCRTKYGLRYLQPGRFICTGPANDAPFMWFFPLAVPATTPKQGTVAALLEERFIAYQRHVRATFFNTHFASCDRQVMLVDVLGALYAGRAAFEDTARAIKDLAAAISFGSNSLTRSIAAGVIHGTGQMLPAIVGRATQSAAHKLGNRRIERVAFVATKSDHVPATKRDNLLNLLRVVAAPTFSQLLAGVTISHSVAASILSTVDGTKKLDGTTLEVVVGIVLGQEKARPFLSVRCHPIIPLRVSGMTPSSNSRSSGRLRLTRKAPRESRTSILTRSSMISLGICCDDDGPTLPRR